MSSHTMDNRATAAQAATVYNHITGGRITDSGTPATSVVVHADAYAFTLTARAVATVLHDLSARIVDDGLDGPSAADLLTASGHEQRGIAEAKAGG